MNVAIVCGGRSMESDISVITAMQALSGIDKNRYNAKIVYLFDGKFYIDRLGSIEDFISFDKSKHTQVILYNGAFYKKTHLSFKPYFKPDCALICCHGGEGENGVLQSLFTFNNIPITSCGVMQSAIGMNKHYQKRLFKDMGLDVLDDVIINIDDYNKDKDGVISNISSTFDFPVIVKPCTLGSSIGIQIATDYDKLKYAFDVAFCYDDVVLIEHKLDNFIEINCAAIKMGDDIIISSTEQPIASNDVLTFDDKYLNNGKMSAITHIFPAKIGDMNDVIKDMTSKIYKGLDMNGVVRVDYLIDKDTSTIYVNEINTIPGSLAYYLFEDMSFTSIIDTLICNAKKGESMKCEFKSNVLSHFKSGCKISK